MRLIDMNQHTASRFGDDFVERFRSKNAKLRVRERPLTYDIAVGEEYEHWRTWMDDQVALLSPEKAELVSGRIWQETSHWPNIFELATGAALRTAGYTVESDQLWDGQTSSAMVHVERAAARRSSACRR